MKPIANARRFREQQVCLCVTHWANLMSGTGHVYVADRAEACDVCECWWKLAQLKALCLHRSAVSASEVLRVIERGPGPTEEDNEKRTGGRTRTKCRIVVRRGNRKLPPASDAGPILRDWRRRRKSEEPPF